MVVIQTTTAIFTPEIEQRIGRLALEQYLLWVAVLEWLDEQPHPPEVQHKPRRENAPMWREAMDARTTFLQTMADACGFEKDAHLL
jgi:hypothetical protein